MNNLLVLGGTGFVGTSLCRWIATHARHGGRITVPTRKPAQAKHLLTLPMVDLVEADVFDPAQLAALVARADAVVNLVAILHGSEAGFQRVHVELPRLLAGACHAAGVPRVVHVSALGVGPDAPSRYLRSKTAGEALLRDAGLAVTVLRPSVIFGAEDRFMNLFARLQRFAPVVPLAGATAQFQPVWVRDVAAAIAVCLERPATAGQVYECVGPDVFSLADLVRLAGRWSGHERTVIPLPDALGRLQAGVMERLPGAPLMSRDNLDSMRTPNIASGRLPTLHELGIGAASLASVVPRVLGW